jgi:prephenate dehydratase
MSTNIRNPIIAFQGEPGAFSEHAALSYFGEEITLLPCGFFVDLFEAVSTNRASAAMVPIENSLTGSVLQNYDLLLRYPLVITGEIILRIGQHFMALPGVAETDVRKVYSHPQALDQCREFLSSLRKIEIIPSADTAGSAKMIAEKKLRDAAAIAGERAAGVYGLHILRRHIEDNHRNYTRFLIVEKTPRVPVREESAKTSVVFTTPHSPGSLYRALGVFAAREVNLLKIESRPLQGNPWQYSFHVDLEGDASSGPCRLAIEELGGIATTMRVLGSYAKGKIIDDVKLSQSF